MALLRSMAVVRLENTILTLADASKRCKNMGPANGASAAICEFLAINPTSRPCWHGYLLVGAARTCRSSESLAGGCETGSCPRARMNEPSNTQWQILSKCTVLTATASLAPKIAAGTLEAIVADSVGVVGAEVGYLQQKSKPET